MNQVVFARHLLTAAGWRRNARVVIDKAGIIRSVRTANGRGADKTVGVLLPAAGNVHCHSFQRAIAGLGEARGGAETDDFWSWRRFMYAFLERLGPADIEAIAAQVQMQMLEAGFAAVGEFHYVHHQAGGVPYAQPAELTLRLLSAAGETGIGYTHLPVLYMRGGLDDRPLQAAQLRFGCDVDRFARLYQDMRQAMAHCPADYRLGVAPHSLRAVTAEGLAFVEQLSAGAPIHIHIAEQVAEVSAVQQALGARPLRWLLDHCAVDARWCLVHATHASADEVSAIAARKSVVGVCPITEANLGDGIFAAARFSAAGGRLAIGSDANVRISLAEELRSLEYSQRLRHQQRLVLAGGGHSCGRFLYQQALAGGAQALARNAGAIAVGAVADLVALDDGSQLLEGLQGDALLDAWIFAGDDRLVTDTWSAGRHVVENGRHIRREQIGARFAATMRRLRRDL